MENEEIDIYDNDGEDARKTPDADIIDKVAQCFWQDVEPRNDLGHFDFAHLVLVLGEKIYENKIVEKCEHFWDEDGLNVK
jgi:hypothetical protein